MNERACTVVHQGKRFRAGGARVTSTEIIAYPAAGGVLNDWHGRPIGTWRRIAHWLTGRRWGLPTVVMQIRADVAGVEYSGRGQGPGMIFRGRALKGGRS